MERAPILEFDAEPTALLEPSEIYAARRGSIPPAAVLCFFAEVLEDVRKRESLEPIGRLVAAHGAHSIYALRRAHPVAVFHPGVGAPLAAAFLEEAIALGASRVVACGGAGAVSKELALGHIVIPTSAIRDEGTSYHYVPAGREIEADPDGIAVAERVLQRRGVAYTLGKTWTTDGVYRETRARISRRRNEGCITVEMEAAAFFAVARFRGIRFAQLLHAGDDVSGATWDERKGTTNPSRQLTFDLAVEIALEL